MKIYISKENKVKGPNRKKKKPLNKNTLEPQRNKSRNHIQNLRKGDFIKKKVVINEQLWNKANVQISEM